MSDMFVGSQAPMYQNVCITRRSKTGKILEQRTAKNRITKLMLFGICKFLLGHFNDSSPDKIYEYIPRYLALGTNTPGPDANIAGVTTVSSVNDARLLNEITQSSTTGASESVKRVWIAERNMCKLNSKFSDPLMKVSIKTYISSNHYDGVSIGEAGLFSKEKDNNCLARVCFSPIVKNPDEVLDIQWDITLLSYGETKYAEKLQIDNGSKIVLPLRYTNKLFKTIYTGLQINTFDNTIGSELKSDIFTYDYTGAVKCNYTNLELKNTDWYITLQNAGLDSIFELLIELLSESKLDNTNNPYYLISTNQNVPIMIHFGALYNNSDGELLDESKLYMTLLYNEDYEYKHTETGWTYKGNSTTGDYTIYSPQLDTEIYKVVSNRIYGKSEIDPTKWVETNAFFYNGTIVNMNQESTGYTYSNKKLYKTKVTTKEILVNEFLNYSNTIDSTTLLSDEKLHIYKFDVNGTIQRSGYTIDYIDDQKIYYNGDYTDYHLSRENYWVTGEYEKLIPVITPKDATDKSVDWFMQNTDIAKINWDGVVTAWNLGETSAVASTINDLRAKCIIEVVKDSTFIDIDSINLTPSEITFNIDGNANQSYVLTATIEPLFASNPTLTWSASSEISPCISIINLGDNKVKVILNGSGNIGVGYITATSQSGKSAECLVKVIYGRNSEDDCPDESHLNQKG